MTNPGHTLRALRERLGLTLRDVEEASLRLVERHKNEDFGLTLSRLSDIETKGVTPNIYRLHALAVIYRQDIRDLLALYGINVNETVKDLEVSSPTRTHMLRAADTAVAVTMPVKLDPAFDLRTTTNIGRMIEQWGQVPMAFLAELASQKFSYGYVGSDDFTMYPLIQPGSFIQVDETKNDVVHATWHAEYERPIYFVETREGYVVCWCAVKGDKIVLQPHPLSPVLPKVMKKNQDAEVIGQVVGVAMRLGEWRPYPNGQAPKSSPALAQNGGAKNPASS